MYLRQLVADLSETEAIMADRDLGMNRMTHYSTNRLVLSFGSLPRPPRDSVEQWLMGISYLASPRPVLGTAEALVASGDFGAVRDDSLRASILRYLDVTRERMADQATFVGLARDTYLVGPEGLLWELFSASDSQIDYREAYILRYFAIPRDTVGGGASPDWRNPFPNDVMELYESPDFFRKLTSYRAQVLELQRARNVFAGSAAELRERIEDHLAR